MTMDPAEVEELRQHVGLSERTMAYALRIASARSQESLLVAVVRLVKDNLDLQAELTRLRGGRKRRPKSSTAPTR